MDVSCFEVNFDHRSDGSVELVVYAVYLDYRFSPIRHYRERIFSSRYSSFDNSFSRIANLCIPKRFQQVKVSQSVFDIALPFSVWTLYTQIYGFIHADDIKAMKSALDYYDICYDFDKLIADLPF